MDRTIELVDRIAEYIVEHDLGFQLGFLIVAMSPASDMDRSKGFVGLVNRITKYIEENDLRLLLGILTVASLLLALFLTIQELYYCDFSLVIQNNPRQRGITLVEDAWIDPIYIEAEAPARVDFVQAYTRAGPGPLILARE